MFALVVDGALYLKTAVETGSQFLQRSLDAFSYVRQNKPCQLCYGQAPQASLDDPDNMRNRANKAYACAVGAASRHAKTTKPLQAARPAVQGAELRVSAALAPPYHRP